MQWRGTKADLVRSIRLLPLVLAGTHPDPADLHGIFWGYVGNAVLKLIREAYLVKLDGGEGSDGITWAKLAASTLAKRRRKGRDDEEILIEMGSLLASLRPGTDDRPSGVVDQVFDIGRAGVTVGTAEEKADWHQHGRENMPARPIVPPDGEIPVAWEEPIEAAMQQGLERVIEEMCRVGGIA